MAVCTFLARKKLNYASDHLEEHTNIVHPHAIVKCNVTVDLNNAISFAALCKIISRVMETCFLLFKTSTASHGVTAPLQPASKVKWMLHHLT